MPEGYQNLGGVTSVGTATITAADDLLTITAHGLADGDLVMVDALTGGGSILVEGAKYHARNVTADTFQISATRGGAVIDFASDGGADVFSAVPSYTAQGMRRIQSGLLQRGDFSGGFAARAGVFPNASINEHVSLGATTWTVNNLVAVVVHSTAGPYVVAFTGDSGSLDPADGTNPRIDGLDLQVRDDDEDASGFRDSRIVYVPGTPASSPVAPAVTANAERLVTILVPAGGTPAPSIDTTPRFTVARGGVIPVDDEAAFPTAGGRYEGQLLFNNETNQLIANLNAGSSWGVMATAGGESFIAEEIFSTSGDFTIGDYPGAQSVVVHVQGGGGGGGGCAASTGSDAAVGAGGGAGQYRRGRIAVASLAASETVTIGPGGSGGPDGNTNGSAGGSSSFGTHITAVGGNGGQSEATPSTSPEIMVGGSSTSGGSGGDLTIEGGSGLNGTHKDFVAQQGSGGASVYANSNRGNGTNAGGSGAGATGPGGGGAGGHNNPGGSTARSGGDGGAGLVIVEVWG